VKRSSLGAAALVLLLCLPGAAQTRRLVGTMLMVRPDMTLAPSNAAASVMQLADAAARTALNAERVNLVAEGVAGCEAKADAFEALLQAREGTMWIDAWNVLRIGEREVEQTDITAQIIRFQPRVQNDGTNFWNRVYTFFSEDPGYEPITRIGRSLRATNEWVQATVRSSYLTNITVGATAYEGVAVTEFATPGTWTSAFARVSSQVRGATTNQVYFPVNNGIQVKNEAPLTLVATWGTNSLRIVGGLVCIPQ
jgi:hypothetical protein